MLNKFKQKTHDIKRYLKRRSDSEKILLHRYQSIHGKSLDPASPQTFTEKLFCRMLVLNRKNNRQFTRLADKYLARDYVSRKVGDQYLVKLLWHGKNPAAIPFDSLPDSYVVKTNHGSGQVIVVNGDADRHEITEKLTGWLKTNYYWTAREHHYLYIKPRILIEEYLRSQDGSEVLNYSFWCLNGTPEVIQVDNHAHSINPFFDRQWNTLDLSTRRNLAPAIIERPKNFDEMLIVASQLSKEFDFVRVDLYNLDGKIYFGELTFTPGAGFFKFQPECWDIHLGQKWQMLSES